MKIKIVLSILWFIIWGFLTEYASMPVMSLSASPGFYLNVLFLIIPIGIICFKWDDEEFSLVTWLSTGFSGLTVLILIVVGIASCGACNAGKYRSLIGKIEETKFTANVQPIAPDQMLIVDEEIAHRVGEKELGSDPGLGSRCELGTFTLQAVKGKLYWIAPLLHSGFMKWWTFSNEGTPGYIVVSATNQEDYRLVKSVDNKDLHLRYQTEAYFGQDLERHIYTSGYMSKMFSDMTFEVDDEWHPYWTVTLYDTKVAFGGSDAYGVLTVDPQSGDITEYSIDNAPAWIDRIQPEDFVSDQVDDWGYYVNGAFNWSNKDVIRVVDESSLVLGSDGRSYYYFGLTSQGKENSTVGFVMVDTRTKKAHWFKQAGATELAAKGSAEGKVQEKGYVGSDGITYNIDGRPTYEFLLKDKAGLMKQIALVNVHDHTIVGIGENRHDAIQDYRTQIANRGNSVSIATSEMNIRSITSRVSRFSSQVVKGNSYYLFTLENNPAQIFMVGTNMSDEVPLTREGDRVQVKYVPATVNQEVSIMAFDNLNLGTYKDSSQIRQEALLDSVRATKINAESNKVMDDEWDKLTPEEKRRLMRKDKN